MYMRTNETLAADWPLGTGGGIHLLSTGSLILILRPHLLGIFIYCLYYLRALRASRDLRALRDLRASRCLRDLRASRALGPFFLVNATNGLPASGA